MSRYTIDIKGLIAQNFDLGLRDYPIFDETYRKILNNKIINHFYLREIGQETPELFKFMLNRKMHEIMPYYNKLYESELLNFDPFTNFKEMTEYTKSQDISDSYHDSQSESGNSSKQDSSESSQTNSSENSASGLSVYSDTPQGNIDIVQLNNNTYATNAQKFNNSGNESGEINGSDSAESNAEYSASKTINSTNNRDFDENGEKSITGSKGENPSEMLKKYRETLLNIDMMIIAELNGLFMLLY